MEELQNHEAYNNKVSKDYKNETITEKEVDYWKDYTYGQDKQKLRPGIEVEKEGVLQDPRIETHTHDGTANNGVQIDYANITNTPTLRLKSVYYTGWAGAYTAGDFFISCGFTPTKITVKSARAGGGEGMSTGDYINTPVGITNYCIYSDSSSGEFNSSSNRCIYINPATTPTTGYVSSITTSGATFRIDNNNYQFNATIIFEGFE